MVILNIDKYMSKVLLNIKTDKEVKEEASKIAKELGVPLSTVVNAYLKEFVREKSIKISIEPRIRPEIGKLLKKSSEDYRKKKNISREFASAQEAVEYLYS